MNDVYKPREDFVDFLERQIRTVFDRQDRISRSVKPASLRYLGLAALVSISVICGAAGVLATVKIQESRQKALLVARAEMELRLIELEIDLIRSEVGEVQNQFEAGLVGRESLIIARGKLLKAESVLLCKRLNLQEIQISGEKPKDDLSAPLIGERDFVTERLKHRLDGAQTVAEEADREFHSNRYRFQTNVISVLRYQEAEITLQESIHNCMDLATQIELRDRFLKGELTTEEVEDEARLGELRNRLELLSMLLELAGARHEKMKEMYEAGTVSEVELLRAEITLFEKMQEMELVQRQIQLLTSGRMN